MTDTLTPAAAATAPLEPRRTTPSRGRRARPGDAKRNLTAYAFIGPSLFGVLAFMLLPVLMAAVISFTDWHLLSTPKFAGLDNYAKLLGDERSWASLGRTAYFVLLNIPLQTVLALGIALLLHRRFRGRSFFRAVYVLPWLATPVVLAVIWRWILDPNSGPVAEFLGLFGIQGVNWLQDATLALPAIALVTIWQFTGYTSLFFLAGLQSIPQSLYEAARLDGAGAIQQFFRITLPLLNPTTLFVLITSVIGSFQAFDFIYILTGGGPDRSTEVINFRIYETAFTKFDAGYASALSMLLFAIILIVTVLQLAYFRKRTQYDLS